MVYCVILIEINITTKYILDLEPKVVSPNYVPFTAFPSRAAEMIVFPAGPETLFLTCRFGTCRLEDNKTSCSSVLLSIVLKFPLETSICQGTP